MLVEVGDSGPRRAATSRRRAGPAPGGQRLGPRLDGLGPDQRTRRLVGAVGEEPAVEAPALDHLGLGEVVLAEQLVGR